MTVSLKTYNILVFEYYYSKSNNINSIFPRMKQSANPNMEVMPGELTAM